jgi:hypothetical protein
VPMRTSQDMLFNPMTNALESVAGHEKADGKPQNLLPSGSGYSSPTLSAKSA